MTTGLRRLFATAFIAALAGLGVAAALRSRRPRTRLPTPAEELIPVEGFPPISRTSTKRGRSYALVCLLLLGGLVGVFTASHQTLFGSGGFVPGGGTKTLTVPSPPDATLSRPSARDAEMTTGSLRATVPSGYATQPTPPPPVSAVPRAEDGPAENTQFGTHDHSTPAPAAPPPRGRQAEPSDSAGPGADRRSLAGVPDKATPPPGNRPPAAPAPPDASAATLHRLDDKPAMGMPGKAADPEQDPARDREETAARQDAPNGGASAFTPGNDPRRVDLDGANTGNRVGDGGDASRAALAANISLRPRIGATDVLAPGADTTRIVRGDSLWRISRRSYGEGERYKLIVGANQGRIRDPDLIYPGQVLVLPSRSPPPVEGKRD